MDMTLLKNNKVKEIKILLIKLFIYLFIYLFNYKITLLVLFI